jgi:hypothetical protein
MHLGSIQRQQSLRFQFLANLAHTSPVPEEVGAALVLLPLALDLEVIRDEQHFLQEHIQAQTQVVRIRVQINYLVTDYEGDENLLLGEVLTAGEVAGGLAAAEP